MTTTVINLKGRIREYGPRLEHAPPGMVYVGRRFTMGGWDLPAHPLANPYRVGPDGTRAEVIEKYRAYVLDQPELVTVARSLRGRTLACWCAPEPCHADVIAALATGGTTTSSGGCRTHREETAA